MGNCTCKHLNDIRYLGSSKATTCVLLFFYSKRVFSCAHYDGAESVKVTLDKQIESIFSLDTVHPKKKGRLSKSPWLVDLWEMG